MKNNLEKRLIDARPTGQSGNQKFVDKTMEAIKKTSANETFSKFMRNTNVTKKETFKMKYEKLRWKFKQLPGYIVALIILGSVSTVGAAAYATYRWINPSISITNVQPSNDDGKREYTVDSQCGEFYSGKDLKYELAQDSGLTDEDVRKVFENTCAYNALGTFIDSHWVSDNEPEEVFDKKKVGDTVTIYEYSNSFGGSSESNTIFGITIGTVKAIDNKSVTIEQLIYAVDNTADSETDTPFKYYPEGKVFTRTLPLAQDFEVWQDGNMQSQTNVRIGDTVQIVNRTKNKVQYYEDIKQNALGEQISFDTVGIIKTNIDIKYVVGIGDPEITYALAPLAPCAGNEKYLCSSLPNQILYQVYQTIDLYSTPEDYKDNQYIRKDLDIYNPDNLHSLDGRITSIDGKKVTLETRGQKNTFTVEFPYDALGGYSKTRNLKVEIGDYVQVSYIQPSNEDHLDIKPRDLQFFAILQQTQPDGSLKKY